VFVSKNGLGRFPEFRDQGVGGSNPLSPTIPNQSLTYSDFPTLALPSARTVESIWQPASIGTLFSRFSSGGWRTVQGESGAGPAIAPCCSSFESGPLLTWPL
jgi:hypothetical protein